MPNWPMSESVRTYIRQRATLLSDRVLRYSLADFPLTVEQLQSIVLPAEQLAAMKKLVSEGVRTIEKHKQIRIALLRDHLPELNRAAVLQLWLPEQIFVGRGTQYGISTTKFSVTENHYLVPRFDQLDDLTRSQLVAWTAQAVRQTRLHVIVHQTVSEVTESRWMELVPTAAHAHAFWPMLTTLTTKLPNMQHDHVADMWTPRFANPTRSLRAYQPDAAEVTRYQKVILACDSVLAAGKILSPYKAPDKTITVQVEHWEPRDGDISFPLA